MTARKQLPPSSVVITPCANGYIVREMPFFGDISGATVNEPTSWHVFNHIEHLYDWMQDHFEDRVESMTDEMMRRFKDQS